MKFAFVLFICAGVTLWCGRELVVGFRRGSMSTLAAGSRQASRAEKPRVFWFNVGVNVFTAAAMILVAIIELIRLQSI